MKLIYSCANLLTIFNHHAINGVHATVNNNDRRLQLNQAEAAKRVDDAVDEAMLSVENGDVTGIAFPLNYVVLSNEVGGQQQLTVNLRLPGVDRNQNIMIDTGSSSLAFCNKSLAEEANISKVNYAQCNTYGNLQTCPDNSTGLYSMFYVGQVYEGDVAVYNNQGDEIAFASMDNASFTIIEAVQNYMCFGPLDGIAGVAFDKINWGFAVEPSLDFDAMSLWNDSCKNPDQYAFSVGYETLGTCAYGNLTQTTLPSPLESALAEDVESGYNTAKAFGLYCDYAATYDSEVDTVIPSLGIYFGGDLALNNQFYNNGKAHVAQQLECGGENEWYLLGFNAIRVPSLNFTQNTTELCSQCSNCFTDSGTSWIALPLSEEFCNSIPNNVDELKSLGSLYIDLLGTEGGNVTLTLPLLWLGEQYMNGKVNCVGESGSFILGFPIFQYYYLVYDMGNNTVVFVDLELSNETERFIDSGGYAPTSAGYLLYQALTTGILVLASCIYLWK